MGARKCSGEPRRRVMAETTRQCVSEEMVVARHEDFQSRAGARAGGDPERAADGFSALTHADQSKAFPADRIKGEPQAIVFDRQNDFAPVARELNRHMARATVFDAVEQRLLANAVETQ